MDLHYLIRQETRQTERVIQDEYQTQLEPEGRWIMGDQEAEVTSRDVWCLINWSAQKTKYWILWMDAERTRVFYPAPNSTPLGE